ncbi:MAG: fasciclin domain-containing protein, partial [Bacteroidales bacterium]|nr:fasciclin domain-containing protein [Bacteroidales bacterium]
NEPKYSEFLNYIHQYGLDSIITGEESKTLFIPNNDAFDRLLSSDTTGFMKNIMAYHITQTVFLSNNLQDSRKLLSTLGKYITISEFDESLLIDGIPVNFSSPLYLDGRYYELPELLIPIPSIYSYIHLNSPVLRKYIDSFDSISIDKSQSIPIGYNEKDEIVYDSVYIEFNQFEEDFFPISEEFRSRTATMMVFTQEQYEEAIDIMASNMGTTASSIPEKWQFEVLLPYLMKQNVFEGSVDYEDLTSESLNIQGDTSFINVTHIDANSKYACSNGLIYNYKNFRVPEELYLEQRCFEAEDYLVSLGLGRYVWNSEFVTVQSDISTVPMVQETDLASNDTTVSISLAYNYEGSYSIEFLLDNVFPGNYVLEWRGSYRPSGNFRVYVNNVDVTSTSPMVFDGVFDLYLMRDLIGSVVPGGLYIPDLGKNNTIDFLVKDIVSEYGSIKVKIEYVDKGSQSNNGLSIDYLALTPYQY